MNTDVQKIFALRLHPGQDLKKSLFEFVNNQNILAGYVITCVGSLQQACIRYAGRSEAVINHERFEIVSLTGTLCPDGLHLHISLADSEGQVTGGHLMDENLIYTTAEIAIGNAAGIEFKRRQDEATGYKELNIRAV